MVFEPNLKLMVLTKENVAAQAFAEHIEGLHMPPCVNEKIGRLVGYMELKKNRSAPSHTHRFRSGSLKLPNPHDESQQFGTKDTADGQVGFTFQQCKHKGPKC